MLTQRKRYRKNLKNRKAHDLKALRYRNKKIGVTGFEPATSTSDEQRIYRNCEELF